MRVLLIALLAAISYAQTVPVYTFQSTPSDRYFEQRCHEASAEELALLPISGSYVISARFNFTDRTDVNTNGGIVGWGNYGNNNEVLALRMKPNGMHHYWWANDISADLQGLNDNHYHEVTVKYDQRTEQRFFYVDGLLRNQQTNNGGTLAASTDNFCIGKTTGGEFFTGEIDYVAVYAGAVSLNCREGWARVSTNMKCNNEFTIESDGVTSNVADEEACRQIADANNHKYLSYRTDGYCYTTSTECDNPQNTNETPMWATHRRAQLCRPPNLPQTEEFTFYASSVNIGCAGDTLRTASGNSMTANGLEQCKEQCHFNDDCSGFTYIIDDSQCFFKTGNLASGVLSGAVCYSKNGNIQGGSQTNLASEGDSGASLGFTMIVLIILCSLLGCFCCLIGMGSLGIIDCAKYAAQDTRV